MWLHHFFYLLVIFFCQINSVAAAPAVALGYTPKYSANFNHFDYVNPDAPKGGELILSGMGNFESLNPYIIGAIPASYIGLLFDTLMEQSQDEPFSSYGLLAQDVELAENKLSVTFRLNPKARFSDGSEVTAEDVKFSFDTLKSKQAAPNYRVYWADIQKAEVIDKHTVSFSFAKVNRELHMIIGQLPVFSKVALQDRQFDKIVNEPLLGSGAYLIDKFKIGKYITYKRNPDYWAKELNTRRGMYNFDKITVKYYKEQSIGLEALKSGEFDFMAVYSSKQWARDVEGPQFDENKIKKIELPHKNNAGMQGLVFNLRKPIFQDIRVRQAINLAFDFEWANKNLFYQQYKRCYSYFSNSDLAATGLPSEDELVLLAPFRDKLPEAVFTQVWQPVASGSPEILRSNLVKAKNLLAEAGWKLQDGVLQKTVISDTGQSETLKLEFEIMLTRQGFERILAPFEHNLNKLGIKINYRPIDTAVYQKKQEEFQYDMLVAVFSGSQFPGNELMNLWHSASANQPGSGNLMGLHDPVVDALIEKVIYANTRAELLTAVHALDRVMLHQEYVVPNWFINTHRVAFWDKFGHPPTLPLYYQAEDWVIQTWWMPTVEKKN
jgi:microcin C transport system substrate-binding protein